MGGPKQEKREWDRRRTREIYCHYRLLNIVDEIKLRRLGFAGNTRITEEEMAPKRIVNGKFHNTRSVGKPRRRWEEQPIGTRYRSQENENAGDGLGIEKNKGDC
jgi:hypothetical protein